MVVPPSVGRGEGLPVGMMMGGRWTVMKQLGKGAMGAVYLVQDSRLSNRRAALKEMLDRSETLGSRQEAIERFNREAETLAALTHASIPHIYDRFTDGDRIYMVMEFVDGLDLEKLLYKYRDAHGGALPEHVVARYAYQLAGVLDYLHKQSPPTLHRDLKPSNIILHVGGHLKLIDFGIARIFNPGSQGTGLGTQGYAAPEQYKGQAEPKTDIYALGATMHHLLTSRDPQLEAPFDYPPVSELATVTQPLEELVTAMLSMRPESRPSAGEVKRQLAQLYPGIHDADEDPRVLQVLGARPRPVTRKLQPPAPPPAPGVTAPPAYSAPPPAPGVAAPPAYSAPPPVPGVAAPPAFTPPPMPPAYSPATPVASSPPTPAQPPVTPAFCTQCGTRLIPGARFCTGCGKSYATAPPPQPPSPAPAPVAPPESGPLELRIPAHLNGTEPLEYVAFDDSEEPACLLGVVKQGETEYAFVCAGPKVATDALVEVYVQRWQGSDAYFEPINRESPDVARDVRAAWASFRNRT